MCSIVGLLDKNGHNVCGKIVDMMEITAHRGPDGCGLVMGAQIKKSEGLETLDASDISGSSGMGHLRLRITGTSGTQPLSGCEKRFVVGFNGEIWNYKQLRERLQVCGHDFETDSDSEVIVHLIEENYHRASSFPDSVARTVKMLDGEWAFAVIDNATKKVILARDPVGVKQLYFGNDSRYIAFASEKKPLLKLGISPKRVPPGNTAEINFGDGSNVYDFKTRQVNEIKKIPVRIFNESQALHTYEKALVEAVRKRVDGQKHIGVIFSGGVDSVLIAQIAKNLGVNTTCYTSGTSCSADVLAARRVAKEMNLELKENIITEDKISSSLNDIISAIESTDHLQVDVAIPVYFAVEAAKQDNVRIMLTGQGADELFAGYPWYPQVLKEGGSDELNKCLWEDIRSLYKDTLEREDKITMHHSTELRVPYLDPDVIEASMSISEDLKIMGNHGKYIHRKLAESVGVPRYVSWRPKEAAQHGSDSHEKLFAVLKKKHVSLKSKISTSKIEHEKLGSAYRYKHDVYSDNKDIQSILNYLGEEAGLYAS